MDYDWPYIQMRFESGETAYAISKAMGGKPSKQGIQKRANADSWQQGCRDVPKQLPVVAAALNVKSHKLTDELLNTVLQLIASGATENLACQAAGITQKTWIDWKSQDDRLKNAVSRARAGKLSEWIGRIDNASQKDWKAAHALLQASPETRDSFSKGSGGGKLEVVINIDRTAGTKANPSVIESSAQQLD